MNNKKQWILNYLLNKSNTVDMLNQEFVNSYIDTFNPKHTITNFGANKCKELSGILSEMNKDGILKRCAVGLHGIKLGFPKWIYVYEVY